MKFRAVVIASGNANAVVAPDATAAELGGVARPPIAVVINGHSWRTRLARMRGQSLIGLSAAHCAAAGIARGDHVEVEVRLDTEPREVATPPDLSQALAASGDAGAAFARLPFGLKGKHVREIEAAKTPEVRERRIRKLVDQFRLGAGAGRAPGS